LVPDPKTFLAHNLVVAIARELPEPISAFLGDAAGQNTVWDALRQHLSSYGSDHFGEDGGRARALFDAARPPSGALAFDLGCGPGALTHALARDHDFVLGVDMHFGLLRLAAGVLRSGVATYPQRISGLRYKEMRHSVRLDHADRVDFWCCDATALPFDDALVDTALSLNLVDCVASPTDHLSELGRVLTPGGHATLSTPFDWAPQVTPAAAWLDAESLIDALGPLEVLERTDHPWGVYIHERRVSGYRALLLRLQRAADR
jgi:SAM-dependent methyltransferase